MSLTPSLGNAQVEQEPQGELQNLAALSFAPLRSFPVEVRGLGQSPSSPQARAVRADHVGSMLEVNSVHFHRPSDIQLEKEVISPQTLIPGSAVLRLSIAAKLRESGAYEKAEVLEQCEQTETICYCFDCQKHRVFKNRCSLFYCPSCADRLTGLRRKTLRFWAEQVTQPKHVVLTSRNTASLSSVRVRWFKSQFNGLRRSSWAKGWKSGMYSIEVTNEGRGWHLHLHALIDSNWIDAPELARRWGKRMNQDFAIVKVKDARESNYLAEVIKYTAKPAQVSQWKPYEIREWIEALDGTRCFSTFGQLYRERAERKKQLDEILEHSCECSFCQSTKLRFMSPAEFEAAECTGQIKTARVIP